MTKARVILTERDLTQAERELTEEVADARPVYYASNGPEQESIADESTFDYDDPDYLAAQYLR